MQCTFIVETVSIATLLVSTNVPPAYGAPLVFVWNIVLLIMFWMKPVLFRRVRVTESYKLLC